MEDSPFFKRGAVAERVEKRGIVATKEVTTHESAGVGGTN